MFPSATSIGQLPALQSDVDQTCASPRVSRHSSICEIGYASLALSSLNFRESLQNRGSSPGLGTLTTVLYYFPVAGSVTPIECTIPYCSASASRVPGPAFS